VLFLDLNTSDFHEDFSLIDNEIPLYGQNSILPKEHGERFHSLPIIRHPNKDVGAVASWDSSIHESTYLNKVTDTNERAYMIVKVVVRLSYPTPMDLVLRKRICFNIFKRQSLTDQIRRRIGYSISPDSVGVVYEIVSNVPKASEQLENGESLAAIAASGQDDLSVDGETFIEKYTKGAVAVDEILRLEKIRQNVAIKEILVTRQKNESPVQSMRKTLSVPNMSSVMRHSFSLDNVSGLKMKSSETCQELSLELSGRSSKSFGPPQHQDYSQLGLGKNPSMRRLPMSMTMSTLHEDRNHVHDNNFSQKEYLVPSADLRKTSTRQLKKSQTAANISNFSLEGNSTSPVSSGYESQTVSCTTLSRESSLDPDESIDQVYHKGGYCDNSSESCSEEKQGSRLKEKNHIKSNNTQGFHSSTTDSSVSADPTSVNVGSKVDKRDSISQTIPDWIVVGESVQIRPSNLSGVVRFIGKTDFAPGNWIGVELDTPQGKNNGSIEGRQYFSCDPKKGMFVKPKNLKLDRRGREMRATKPHT